MISFTLQNFVLSADAIPSTAKAVYMQLMAKADEYRKCFPSVDTLAYYVGRSPRTVQRSLKLLCEQGLIHKESRYRLNNSQTSNLYTLAEQSAVTGIVPKPLKKSFAAKTAFTARELPEAASCIPQGITVEAAADSIPNARKNGQKKDGICEETHIPSRDTFPTQLESTFKISQPEVLCQGESMNKPLIPRKSTIALLFARYFVFTGIPFKEVYRMMTSPELQASVYSSTNLSNTAKLVFVYLCAKADEKQRCIVNPTKLARSFSRSKRTIQRALTELYMQNLITTEDRRNLSGSQSSCIYTIRRLD